MVVQKFVDLNATGATIEEAVTDALARATLRLEGVTSFDIEHIDGTFDEGKPVFRVRLRVSFILMDRLHG